MSRYVLKVGGMDEVWHLRHGEICVGCGEGWPCVAKRRQLQRDVEKLYPAPTEEREAQ